MSSMLEQAIIDAAALREAAMKNAEQIVIDKYASEVKEAVESLLEVDEFGFEEEGVEGAAPAAVEREAEEMEFPVAALEGEPGGCAADEEIEISFSQLEKMADELSDEEMGAPEASEDLAAELAPDAAASAAAEEQGLAMPPLEEVLSDLTDEDIEEILEDLVVDLKPQKLGQNLGTIEQKNYEEEIALAAAAATETKEENDKLKKAVDKLSESNQTLEEENLKIKGALLQLKEKLDEVNVSNARLLYTNRILNSASLNERQKEKIVEAISKADSVEEAKVICETLQSTVGNTKQKRMPKSLSEAIVKPSSMLPRRDSGNNKNPITERMKILAGIKTK
tara:strand:+ start:2754 stop:3767 length:1014 start_codon:yes stop_codon:yes gene_type:complete